MRIFLRRSLSYAPRSRSAAPILGSLDKDKERMRLHFILFFSTQVINFPNLNNVLIDRRARNHFIFHEYIIDRFLFALKNRKEDGSEFDRKNIPRL